MSVGTCTLKHFESRPWAKFMEQGRLRGMTHGQYFAWLVLNAPQVEAVEVKKEPRGEE
jgi:hypothetical protein